MSCCHPAKRSAPLQPVCTCCCTLSCLQSHFCSCRRCPAFAHTDTCAVPRTLPKLVGGVLSICFMLCQLCHNSLYTHACAVRCLNYLLAIASTLILLCQHRLRPLLRLSSAVMPVLPPVNAAIPSCTLRRTLCCAMSATCNVIITCLPATEFAPAVLLPVVYGCRALLCKTQMYIPPYPPLLPLLQPCTSVHSSTTANNFTFPGPSKCLFVTLGHTAPLHPLRPSSPLPVILSATALPNTFLLSYPVPGRILVEV